jgi:hypothetical protein
MTSVPDIDLHTDYGSTPPGQMGGKLASDHANIESWTNTKLLPTLAKVIRDDDTLKSGIVRTRNLHPEVIAAMGTGAGSSDPSVLLVESYGAVGDGVTDDTQAVIDCIEAAPAGSTVKFNGEKHYYLRSLDTITKPLTIDGGGCRITCAVADGTGAGAPLFSFSGSLGSNIAADAVALSAVIITATMPADASTFAAGDYVRIKSSDAVPMWDASGTANASLHEINRVASVDAGTGDIGLCFPIANAMTTGVVIAKITEVHGPRVQNFGSIEEVYGGSSYAGVNQQGPNAANIVDFYLCVNPAANDITINGWNLLALSSHTCIGGMLRNITGKDPFNPTVGGNSNVTKSSYCRDMRKTAIRGYNSRHVVDWVGCHDSSSDQCLGVMDDDTITSTTSAFETHGLRSSRIKSHLDTAINCNGWTVGNYTFSYDTDIEVSSFTHLGTFPLLTAITVTALADGVNIHDCNISNYYNGIRINRLSRNVRIDRCNIHSQNGSCIWFTDADSGKYPTNISITNSVLRTDGAAHNAVLGDAYGDIIITGNTVYGYTGIRICDNIAATNVDVSHNNMTIPASGAGSIKISASSAYQPSKYYNVSFNAVAGTCTGSAIYMAGATNLLCHNNRSPDQADCVGLYGAVSAGDIVLGGGIFRDNNDNTDSSDFKTNGAVNVPTGTSGGLYLKRQSVARWRMLLDNNTESGGDVGSNWTLQALDDSGATIGDAIYVERPTTGVIGFYRNTIIAGDGTTATSFIVRGAAAQTRTIKFRTGNSDRWMLEVDATAESGSDAGSILYLRARADNGAAIDDVLYCLRAAGSNFTIQRPLRNTSARTGKVNSITSTAGTTGLSGSDHIVVVTGSTTHTLTLVAASTGRILILKNRSTGTVTVNRAGSDTIDGGTTFNLTTGQATTLVANGTDWCRVANA